MSVSASGSVSATSGTDLEAVLGSSTDFAARLASFKESRETLTKALTDLNLGREAAAAYEEAQVQKLAAGRERASAYEALQTEMQRVRDDMAKQVATVRADCQNKTNAVNAALSAAAEKEAQARSALDIARTSLAAAEVKSAKTLAEAQTAADVLLNEAKQKHKTLTDEAVRLRAQAQASFDTAASQKAEWEAKVAKLKAVIG